MNGNEFLEKLELVNPEFINEADTKPKGKRKRLTKWIAAAAAVCLCTTVGVFAINYFDLFNNIFEPDEPDYIWNVESEYATNICISTNNISYSVISFGERVRYGLVSEDAKGLTEENKYKITKSDLGEPMGTVTSCENAELVGCKVYHFAKYPQYDSICIVETNNGYEFYTGNYFSHTDGLNSEYHLSKLNLPEALEKMEVFSDDSDLLFSIEDKDTIAAFFNLISGKEDIGNKAKERRYAEVWYNQYGNDDVYYSEEQGGIVYRYKIISEGYTYTAEDGTEIGVEPKFEDASDEAHELWSKDQRMIVITTDKGFTLSISYSPIINAFSLANNHYSLTETEVQELNALLEIEE